MPGARHVRRVRYLQASSLPCLRSPGSSNTGLPAVPSLCRSCSDNKGNSRRAPRITDFRLQPVSRALVTWIGEREPCRRAAEAVPRTLPGWYVPSPRPTLEGAGCLTTPTPGGTEPPQSLLPQDGQMHLALVIIDVQVAIMDGPEPGCPPIHARDNVLAKIDRLLRNARAAGTLIIHVQHEHPTFTPMMPGASGWQIHPAVAPAAGEMSVRKRAADAFYGTGLRNELDARGVTRLVVASYETAYCVNTTVRRALSLDFDVILAANAHTITSGTEAGWLSPAQIIAHLANLPHPTRQITVVPAANVAF